MIVVFRADASCTIGTGHVMRCMALAETLRNNGAVVHFICRMHEGHLCGLIEQRGFKVTRLHIPSEGLEPDTEPKHANWLGAGWQEDAEETLASIESIGAKPKWLIADHYAIDQRWEQYMRPFVERILIIDDMADRNHDCDLLLDQNLVENMENRYRRWVPRQCVTLLGPHFALLQSSYAELHACSPVRSGPIKRIHIFFGGADRKNLTGMALQAFLRLQRSDIEADVVISGNSPHVEMVESLAKGRANVHLHRGLPSLAPLMAKADLGIGAAGATSWERLCLGLPAIVITLAENQRPVASHLHNIGVVRYLGHQDNVTAELLMTELITFTNMKDLDAFEAPLTHFKSVVDGLGASRVAHRLALQGNVSHTEVF